MSEPSSTTITSFSALLSERERILVRHSLSIDMSSLWYVTTNDISGLFPLLLSIVSAIVMIQFLFSDAKIQFFLEQTPIIAFFSTYYYNKKAENDVFPTVWLQKNYRQTAIATF